MDPLEVLNQEIVVCTRCPRLVEYRAEVARVKRRAYRDCEYWGRPVPGFGDPHARLLLIGLAPGAHGSNRTGRMFTGDSSGDFLYGALFATGFAPQPVSVSKDDGLTLRDAYISAAARCAPPDNKPTPQEIRNCRPYLERELELLKNLRVVLALGRVAFDVYLAILRKEGKGQLWKLKELVAKNSEAQTGCPITYTYTREEGRELMERHGFRARTIAVDHIFPYRIKDYVQYRYVREFYFRWMPAPLFRALEKRLGWHLCITAEA